MAVQVVGRVLEDTFDRDVWFTGELLHLDSGAGGHGYAVLQGQKSRMHVYLPPRLMLAAPAPQKGTVVLVQGRLGIWRPGGKFQVRARTPVMPTDSAGARAQARRAAEQQLRAEGVFGGPRKELPRWPSEIAVLTSARGAAIHDVRVAIGRRAHWVNVRLHDCIVQGPRAVDSIIAALDSAEGSAADLVLLTRGGGDPGAFEPFDDPRLVRRIANCPLPIVVAIGHQSDRTLADVAADQAAATPTAAAELAVPEAKVLRRELQVHRRQLHRAARVISAAARARADHGIEAVQRESRRHILLWRERVRRVGPEALWPALVRRLREERARVLEARRAALRAARALLREQRRRARALRPELLVTFGEAAIKADRHRAVELIAAVRALSPTKVLARGYALLMTHDGHPIRSSRNVRSGDRLLVRLHDGTVAVVVAAPPMRPIPGEHG